MQWSSQSRDSPPVAHISRGIPVYGSPSRALFHYDLPTAERPEPSRTTPNRSSSNERRRTPTRRGQSGTDRASHFEAQVYYMCETFSKNSLAGIEAEVNTICHGALRNEFLGVSDQKKLETSLERIYNFLASLESQLKSEHRPSETDVEVKFPPRPKLVKNVAPGWTDDEKAQMDRLKKQLSEAKARLKSEQGELAGLRRDLKRWLEEADAQRRRVAAELAKVQPALDRALQGLAEIKEDHLIEVRSYQTPPPMVSKVMESVLTLIGESKASDWSTITSYVKRRDFIPTVRDFKPETVTEDARKRVRKLMNDPTLTHENAYRASRAAAPLLVWVKAMLEYAEALIKVKPLQDQLDKLNRDIAEAEAELERRSRFGALADIAKLKEQLAQFTDAELQRRANEQARKDGEENARLLAEWERLCQAELQKAADEAARKERNRPIPISLNWMERTEEVLDVRRRCNVVIKAVTATMNRMLLPTHPMPLVVQRGHWANTIKSSPARGQSPFRSGRSPTVATSPAQQFPPAPQNTPSRADGSPVSVLSVPQSPPGGSFRRTYSPSSIGGKQTRAWSPGRTTGPALIDKIMSQSSPNTLRFSSSRAVSPMRDPAMRVLSSPVSSPVSSSYAGQGQQSQVSYQASPSQTSVYKLPDNAQSDGRAARFRPSLSARGGAAASGSETWFDPDHNNLLIPRRVAESNLLFVGTKESSPSVETDGSIRYQML